MSNGAYCNPAELLRLDGELLKSPHNLGIGVIDQSVGQIRIFTYDETDEYSRNNVHLQAMAGHEAAAHRAGFAIEQTRGFVLGKLGTDWQVFNQSHLNQGDCQSNPMRMDPQLFQEIVTALRAAGAQNLIVH